MKARKVYMLSVVLITVSGCTPKYLTELEPLPENFKTTLVLVDKRPNGQKETAFVSLNIANCKYGSFQLGDDGFQPDRVSTLEYFLENHLDAQKRQTQINLVNYTTHVNRSAMLRKAQGDRFYGLMAHHITSQHTMGCSPDDLFGGYNSGEVPEGRVPIIVVIDVEIEGRKFHGRGVAPIQSEHAGKQFPGWNEDVQKATTLAMENLVLAIEGGHFAPTGE